MRSASPTSSSRPTAIHPCADAGVDRATRCALDQVLDREIAAGNALAAALETERAALVGSEVAALEASTTAKERLAREFELADGERRALLARLGYGPSAADMEEVIRALEDPGCSDAGPLATRWRRIVALVASCRDANERNGLIVALQSRRTRQALNVLRTGCANELVYGRTGAGAAAPASRALGRA